MCDVCFDKDLEVTKYACGHSVCELCNDIISKASREGAPDEMSLRRCPASEVCDGMSAIAEGETPIESHQRLVVRLNELDAVHMAKHLKLSLEVDRINTDVIQDLLKDWRAKKLKEFSKFPHLRLVQLHEQLRLEPKHDIDSNCPFKVVMVNGKIEKYTVYAMPFSSNRTEKTVIESNEAYQLTQRTIDGVTETSYKIVDIDKERELMMQEYGNSIVETLVNQINEQKIAITEALGKELKMVEQKIELIEKQLTEHASSEAIIPVPKPIVKRFTFTALNKSVAKFVNKRMTKFVTKVRPFFDIRNAFVLPLLVRHQFNSTSGIHEVGGVYLTALAYRRTFICTFSGDPLGLDKEADEISVDPHVFKEQDSLYLTSNLFAAGDNIYSTGGDSISINPQSFGAYSKCSFSLDIDGPESPWKTDPYARWVFVHEPTRTIYLCGTRINDVIPYASCEY